jgi:hypothetical protein
MQEVASMGNRTRGYGAVHHRPDGRWEGQIRIPGGGRRSFYARTRHEVIRRLTEARWALGQGLLVSAGTTSLATFFDRWLAVSRPRLQPTPMRAYAIGVRQRHHLGEALALTWRDVDLERVS